MNDKTNLRSRLRRFRGSFPVIARCSGISRSWLSKYACGVRGKRPSYDLIQRLAGALDAFEADARTLQPRRPLRKPHGKASATTRAKRSAGSAR